jgi:hypothetical protein
VEKVTENPYLQYFLGLPEYQEDPPFHASSRTHFRKPITRDILNQLNEWVVEEAPGSSKEDESDDDASHHGSGGASKSSVSKPDQSDKSEEPRYHQGNLLIDATCAPADITYPTDVALLNKSREKLEGMIDTLHESHGNRQKKPSKRKPRKGIRKQLNYVKRDLKHVTKLVDQVGLSALSRRQYRDLLVIQAVYRQQKQMYTSKSHRIDDRIVSISQPHVRPIVRGKTHTNVEFGAKLSFVMRDGWAFLDNVRWDTYHEGTDLKRAIASYKNRFGYYPEAVLADRIYLTRENRAYCKREGIRLSGPKLGRPSKKENNEQKRVSYQDALERNAVEGKFGEAKRTYKS